MYISPKLKTSLLEKQEHCLEMLLPNCNCLQLKFRAEMQIINTLESEKG